jgi:hypothetical protein
LAMADDKTVTLFRPVGEEKMRLIRESGFRRFPPRLPSQPIFYPVLNEQYAALIAEKWNLRDESSGNTSYVTQFRVRTDYLQEYEVHTVGTSEHQEYWIPAADLTEFNRNIVGCIEVIAEFRLAGRRSTR